MIAIKHQGKFFITCQGTEETSRTCTKEDACGAYCGAHKTLGRLERKQEEKRMKKKDEKRADLGLEQLGVNPQIYHFETKVYPFTAISIAVESLTWTSVRAALDDIITKTLVFLPHEKATQLRDALAQRDIHGVSICDPRDGFNRRRGRTIAKGRLLKHLKEKEVKNGK